MEIELKIKTHLYSDPDERGKQKIIKRNIVLRRMVNVNDLCCPEEVVDEKGNIRKTHCRITHRELGTLVVNHSYEEMKKAVINKRMEVKGFQINKPKTKNKKK